MSIRQWYCDGSSGNDANNGRTAATPKLTLQAIFDEMPEYIQHNTTLNLSGSFSEFGTSVFLKKNIKAGKILLIDGGSAVTEVLSTLTANTSSISTIGKTGSTWTVDQYAGYIVEITSGARNGDRRLIWSNTATVLTVQADFGADPGNATFRIVRPTTTLTSTSAASALQLSTLGEGTLEVQRLYIAGSQCQIKAWNGGSYKFSQIITNMTSTTVRAIDARRSDYVYLDTQVRSPTTHVATSKTTEHVGCSSQSTACYFYIDGVHAAYLYGGVYKGGIIVVNSNLNEVTEGLRAWGAQFLRSRVATVYSASGYQKVSFDKATAVAVGATGLYIDGTWISIAANVDISTNGNHGFGVYGSSFVRCSNGLTGTSNTGYGVLLVASGTFEFIGTTPTITGSSGDCGVYDGGSVTGGVWTTIDDNVASSILPAKSLGLIQKRS
jgi:hypothetical protein